MSVYLCRQWFDIAEADLRALSEEFPQFDTELLEEMLQDQDGDIKELHACLRVSNCKSSFYFLCCT